MVISQILSLRALPRSSLADTPPGQMGHTLDMRIKQEIGHSLVKTLRSVPGFSTLDDHELLQIVGVSINLHWPEGSLVFEQGTHAEGLYIVLSGRIGIFASSPDGDKEVGFIGPGDFFGELSLLRDETHSKGARAVDDSELLIIPKELFERLLEYDSVLAEHVRDKMRERLRANDSLRSA
jgi:CRP-like cAMP-binding protein